VGYRLLAGTAQGAHFAYLGYLVLGGFLAWRWTWTVWPHALAAAWGFAVVAFSPTCPLTWAEDWARRRGGRPALSHGFMDHYITGVLYPARYESLVRVLVAVVVLASWSGAYLHWRGARA
jgi:Protein of Unknown function (DUF2784)